MLRQHYIVSLFFQLAVPYVDCSIDVYLIQGKHQVDANPNVPNLLRRQLPFLNGTQSSSTFGSTPKSSLTTSTFLASTTESTSSVVAQESGAALTPVTTHTPSSVPGPDSTRSETNSAPETISSANKNGPVSSTIISTSETLPPVSRQVQPSSSSFLKSSSTSPDNEATSSRKATTASSTASSVNHGDRSTLYGTDVKSTIIPSLPTTATPVPPSSTSIIDDASHTASFQSTSVSLLISSPFIVSSPMLVDHSSSSLSRPATTMSEIASSTASTIETISNVDPSSTGTLENLSTVIASTSAVSSSTFSTISAVGPANSVVQSTSVNSDKSFLPSSTAEITSQSTLPGALSSLQVSLAIPTLLFVTISSATTPPASTITPSQSQSLIVQSSLHSNVPSVSGSSLVSDHTSFLSTTIIDPTSTIIVTPQTGHTDIASIPSLSVAIETMNSSIPSTARISTTSDQVMSTFLLSGTSIRWQTAGTPSSIFPDHTQSSLSNGTITSKDSISASTSNPVVASTKPAGSKTTVFPTLFPDNNSSSFLLLKSPLAASTMLLPANNVSSTSIVMSALSFGGLATHTSRLSNPNQTRTESPQIPTPTFSVTNTTLVTLTRTRSSSAQLSDTTPFSSAFRGSSTSLIDASAGSSTAYAAPTSSTTQVAAAPAPPTLTAPQAAGVAIGGLAGALLAAVAAIFLARRYHAARVAKRTSSESSVYPKVAYLYDPTISRSNSSDGGDDDTSALMSGGAGGLPPVRQTPEAPPNTPQNDVPQSASLLRFSDPGNPFSNYDEIFEPVGTLARHASPEPVITTAAEYAEASQWSPTTSSSTQTHRLGDHVIPTPTLSPFMGSQLRGSQLRRSHARSKSWRSTNPKRLRQTVSTSALTNAVATDRRTQSTFGRQPSLASVRESCMTDPFEHDLLLPIDVGTETPNSVVVYAPSPTLGMSTRPGTDDKAPKTTLSELARAESLASQHSCFTEIVDDIASPTFAPSRLMMDSFPPVPSQRTVISDQTLANSNCPGSPISPPYAPTNLGWDDIKRYSQGSPKHSSLSPPPFSFSPPLPNLSPPPKQKRSIMQIRRKELPVTSSGHPLTVHIPFVYKPSTAFEGPRMSLLARVNSLAESSSKYGSRPDTAVSRRMYAAEHKKGSAEQIASPSRWNGEDF